MTVKVLIQRLLNVPVDIEKATITFKDGKVIVTNIDSTDGCGCYLIQ